MLPPDGTDQSFFRDPISADELFSGLTPLYRQDLAAIENHVQILHDNTVFESGDHPLYIYIHRSGRAVLYQDGGLRNTVYGCPAGSNQIYGIVEALSGNVFEVSMKTLTNSDFDVIGRDDFLGFVRDRPILCYALVEIISRMYHRALQEIRSH